MEMWIARDKDGGLYLYTKEPEKYVHLGFFGGLSEPGMGVCGIDRTSFPSVTWRYDDEYDEDEMVKKVAESCSVEVNNIIHW